MVEVLIQAGAEVDPLDGEDRTPLHHAAEMLRPDVVSLLLDQGADIKAADKSGQTPLLKAMCEFIIPDDFERIDLAVRVSNMLLDRRADALMVDYRGVSALHCAARHGFVSIAKRLISLGVDVNAMSYFGTPIAEAAGSIAKVTKPVNMAELLFSHGARLDIPDGRGFYPIHTAAQAGDIDLINLFVRKGADPNARSDDGRTPLDLARYWGNEEAMDYLKATTGR